MPTIVIADEPFGSGFDVTVVPSPAGERLAREFTSHADAIGYAEGLAREQGWAVLDRSSQART